MSEETKRMHEQAEDTLLKKVTGGKNVTDGMLVALAIYRLSGAIDRLREDLCFGQRPDSPPGVLEFIGIQLEERNKVEAGK
jgi:hypothetical protein